MSPPRPLFIDGSSGRLFAIYRAAAPPAPKGPAALLLPPFAEEMNRSRRMLTLQAQALAQHGWASLVIDPFGTGDSDGDFADSRLRRWEADAAAAIDWLVETGHRGLAVVGLRLGAWTAVAAACARPGDIDQLVFWQPVVRGDQMLTQFLRVRLAAGLGTGDATSRETVSALRQRLAAGEVLEVAGYPLSPGLASDLDGVRLSDLAVPDGVPVVWIELAPSPDAELPPASRTVVEGWRASGRTTVARTIAGEPFWSIEETAICPTLIETTTALITQHVRLPA